MPILAIVFIGVSLLTGFQYTNSNHNSAGNVKYDININTMGNNSKYINTSPTSVTTPYNSGQLYISKNLRKVSGDPLMNF